MQQTLTEHLLYNHLARGLRRTHPQLRPASIHRHRLAHVSTHGYICNKALRLDQLLPAEPGPLQEIHTTGCRRCRQTTGNVVPVPPREFRVHMPPDVMPEQYVAIVYAVADVLNAAGLTSQSIIWIDHTATDLGLHQGCDRLSGEIPRSGC